MTSKPSHRVGDGEAELYFGGTPGVLRPDWRPEPEPHAGIPLYYRPNKVWEGTKHVRVGHRTDMRHIGGQSARPEDGLWRYVHSCTCPEGR